MINIEELPENQGVNEQESASLSGLLKLALSLRLDIPVHATPSFREWLGISSEAVWPPPESEGTSGLWLVDTRDAEARRCPPDELLRRGLEPDAVFVLAGSGAPGSPLRKLLRRLRRPGTRRLPVSAVESAFSGVPVAARWYFEDGLEVPADFALGGEPLSGTALIAGNVSVFEGDLWDRVGELLGDPDFQIDAFQLRVRGAAVLIGSAGGQPIVLRVVPRKSEQEVVRRNHTLLTSLRETLSGNPDLLSLLPVPLFEADLDDILVLGETRLPGTLAWKVANPATAPSLHEKATHFLERLRSATLTRDSTTDRELRASLARDRGTLGSADFVGGRVRRALSARIDAAERLLDRRVPAAYMSHGDFGYGNILVDAGSLDLVGVIDWDTARLVDFPGMDRVNLEIQIRRVDFRETFSQAVAGVWTSRTAHSSLNAELGGSDARTLFGLAVSRYIVRSLAYPSVYREEAAGFEEALEWLDLEGRSENPP